MNLHIQATTHRRRNRTWYAVLVVMVIGLGLFWRSKIVSLPPFAEKYGGDALWALAVFLGFGFLLPRASTVRIALVTICFAWSIEFLQLYHAPWIDSLRSFRIGHLVLGSTFNAPDLIAYAVGVAIGALGESVLVHSKVPKT